MRTRSQGSSSSAESLAVPPVPTPRRRVNPPVRALASKFDAPNVPPQGVPIQSLGGPHVLPQGVPIQSLGGSNVLTQGVLVQSLGGSSLPSQGVPIQSSGGTNVLPQGVPVQSLGAPHVSPQGEPIQSLGGPHVPPQGVPIQSLGGSIVSTQGVPIQSLGGTSFPSQNSVHIQPSGGTIVSTQGVPSQSLGGTSFPSQGGVHIQSSGGTIVSTQGVPIQSLGATSLPSQGVSVQSYGGARPKTYSSRPPINQNPIGSLATPFDVGHRQSLAWDSTDFRVNEGSSNVMNFTEREESSVSGGSPFLLDHQVEILNAQLDSIAHCRYEYQDLPDSLYNAYTVLLQNVNAQCHSLVNKGDSRIRHVAADILHDSTELLNAINAARKASNPHNSARQSSVSLQSFNTELNLNDPHTYVTSETLRKEVARLENHLSQQLGMARSQTLQDVDNFITAAETRITSKVLEVVSSEYSQVGLRCIQAKNTLDGDLQVLRDQILSLSRRIEDHATVCPVPHAQVHQSLSARSGGDYNRNGFEYEGYNTTLTPFNSQSSELQSLVFNPPDPPDDSSNPSCSQWSVPSSIPCSPILRPRMSHHDRLLGRDAPIPQPRSLSVQDSRIRRLINNIYSCGNLIKQITDMDFTQLQSRQQIIELATYEQPTLLNLKQEFSDLSKKGDSLGLTDEATLNFVDSIFSSIRMWEHSLNQHRRKHHLHLSGEKTLLKSVDLEPFSGSPDQDTVYYFLETFFRFAESSCSPKDQATLLVKTYLSKELRKEIESMSFKDDIDEIKKYLIRRYGDLRWVTESKLRALSQLKHPNSSKPAQIEYYKQVSQTLLQVESLITSSLVNKDEITGIIYNASYVRSIVSNLPEDMIDLFSKRIESETVDHFPDGKRYFTVLKQLVDHRWRHLESSQSIKALKESGAQPKQTRSGHVASIQDSCGGANSAAHSLPSFASASLNQFVFQCPFHEDQAPHELGNCVRFFECDNPGRLELCKKVFACWSCFKPECLKVSKRACITSVPEGLSCKECAKKKTQRPFNIFVCTSKSHSRPSLKEAVSCLRSYLKIVDRSLFDKLKPTFNLVLPQSTVKVNRGSKGPKSRSTFDPNAAIPSFDVRTGVETKPLSLMKESSEDCVYVFQHIKISNRDCMIFYDSGASGNLVKGRFAEDTGFKTIDPANQRIAGIADMAIWTGYGIYSARLGPDQNGDFWELDFQGIHQITGRFPKYNWSVPNKECIESGLLYNGEILPSIVGGKEPDVLLGFKNPALVPRLEFTLPSGLGCYRCPFNDVNGSSLAYGGCHQVVTEIHKRYGSVSVNQLTIMLTQLQSAYRGMPWMMLDIDSCSYAPLTAPISKFQTQTVETTALTDENLMAASLYRPASNILCVSPECKCEEQHCCGKFGRCSPWVGKAKVPLSKLRQMMDVEEPVFDFRCEDCENCQKCKASPTLKSTSIKERIEQRLIEESVRISYLDRKAYIKLPFTCDPTTFLSKHFNGGSSNIHQALSVYKQQCKKTMDAKVKIREAMSELISLGFIAPLESASQSIQECVASSSVQHYHIWRPVYKDSLSTPCRLVVDPSSTMLNLALAKGDQGIASMFSILLRFRSTPEVWSADIKKLYNQLHLEKECIPYSLLLYDDSLDVDLEPKVYHMCRGWYGIVSTGPQAAAALVKAGKDHAESHPLGSKALLNEAFVDDLNAGQFSQEACKKQVEEVQDILSHIGMQLKYVAFSGSPPPEQASKDGISMTTLGYRWVPEHDELYINIPEINFKRKTRGVKPPNDQPVTDAKSIHDLCLSLKVITRQQIAGKVGEFYDPLGLAEPIKAFYKRSLTRLNCLDWKDQIPDAERQFWTENLKLWPLLAEIGFPRGTIFHDASYPLNIRLIACSDSSDQCGGACVYLSYELNSGAWSTRILTAKSKLMNMSVPRNELHALLIAVELTYAVVVSLNISIKEVLVVTDSLVSLCWVMNQRTRNKVYVQNKIITINRYIRWIQERLGSGSTVDIAHISGTVNPADILTKGEPKPEDIDVDSPWQIGFEWMSKHTSEMPLTHFEDVSLNTDEVTQFMEETFLTDQIFLADYVFYPGEEQESDYFIYLSDGYPNPVANCVISPLVSSSVFGDGTQQVLKVNTKPKLEPKLLIDVIHHGWEKSQRVLQICALFLVKVYHKAHSTSQSIRIRRDMGGRCPICLLSAATIGHQSSTHFEFVNSDDVTLILGTIPCQNLPPDKNRLDMFPDSKLVGSEVQNIAKQNEAPTEASSQLDYVSTILDTESPTFTNIINTVVDIIVNSYWDVFTTRECLLKLSSKELNHYHLDPESQILYYKGRLSNEQSVSVHDLEMLDLKFLDSHEIKFHAPCILPSSDVFYAFCMFIHHSSAPHGGVESTLLQIMKRFHPIKARKQIASIIKDCIRCKIIKRKTLEQEMKNHHSVRLTLAPGFSFIMIDLAQDFQTKVRHQGRQTMRTPALVIVCLVTGATAIHACEDWSTQSVVSALTRHACRYGLPTSIFVDPGGQLKKLQNLSFSFTDFQHRVHTGMSSEVIVSAAKSHSSQGRVERKICIIKDLLVKLGKTGLLMSFLAWETTFAQLSNHLNNLPVCKSSGRSVLSPEFTVLTPNRLLIGKNNERSLSGPMILDASPTQIVDRINEAQETFYQLLVKQIHLLVPKPKWFKTSHVSVGDIVLFFIEENLLKSRNQFWKYGIVTSISGSRLTIQYTTQNSFAKKLIERNKRDVVRIASESELDFNSKSHKEKVLI